MIEILTLNDLLWLIKHGSEGRHPMMPFLLPFYLQDDAIFTSKVKP